MKQSKSKGSKLVKSKTKYKTDKLKINVHPDEVFKVLLSKPAKKSK